MNIPYEEKILSLIQEAIKHVLALGKQDRFALLPVFNETLAVFDATAYNRSAGLLLIASAQHKIARAEKQTVSFLIADQYVSTNEISHLVPIRLICAEIVNLLNEGIDELRQVRKP